MSDRLRTIFCLLACLMLSLSVVASTSAESTEEFGIKEKPHRKETVLDLIFGSAAEMPTEKGILIIDAFVDLDKDGVRGENEPELRDAVTCNIDDIEYTVPAFIPGLDYNNRYEVRCSGTTYFPVLEDKEILIEHRGHVIEIELPCRKNSS